jgi:hypothetical protein
MVISFYFDWSKHSQVAHLYPTVNPSTFKSKDSTRYRVDVEIPDDPEQQDKVVGVKAAEVETPTL